jgi:hypothetical protein
MDFTKARNIARTGEISSASHLVDEPEDVSRILK